MKWNPTTLRPVENSPEPASTLGATILRFDECASTNDRAREFAAQGAGEGVCIVARRQTAGRGRQGRAWSSPPDAGLYLSIILRPKLPAARASLIPLAAAVAVAETLALDFAVAADIKWPNDILVGGRKICGILVESSIENGLLQFAVLGIGVNIAQQEFAPDLEDSATSLSLETQRPVRPQDFLPPLLARLNHWYHQMFSQPEVIIERWQQLSSYAEGCQVRIHSGATILEGVTRGLTASGALVLELEGGERREIVAGEVSLRKVKA